jgi:hypothetical protein
MKKPVVFILFLMLLFSYSAEAQCAMCRAVIESEENGEMAKGINNGIIYLMVFPYLLVGGIGYIIYRSRRKKRAERP